MSKKLPGKSRPAKPASKQSPGSGASRARASGKSPDVKQRRYVRGRLDGKSKKQAAIDAGYAQSTAENAKQKIDEKPAVKKLFTEVLRRSGVSDELLARRALEGLSATEVVRETKYAQREVLVDYSERREMLELVAKLQGHLIDRFEHGVSRSLEEILEASYQLER